MDMVGQEYNSWLICTQDDTIQFACKSTNLSRKNSHVGITNPTFRISGWDKSTNRIHHANILLRIIHLQNKSLQRFFRCLCSLVEKIIDRAEEVLGFQDTFNRFLALPFPIQNCCVSL